MLRYASESNLKRTALELGGKTPQVVFADANLEAAAYDIAWGIYYNSGETCHAGSRLIVHESVREELLERITKVTASITQGHPLDPTTQMGAVIDHGHMDRVLGFIDSGVASGARIALGGHRAMEESGGFYIEATILDGVRPAMKVAREEIFGPVLSVMTFKEEPVAVQMANDTPYGLAAAVWTADINVAHRLAGSQKWEERSQHHQIGRSEHSSRRQQPDRNECTGGQRAGEGEAVDQTIVGRVVLTVADDHGLAV